MTRFPADPQWFGYIKVTTWSVHADLVCTHLLTSFLRPCVQRETQLLHSDGLAPLHIFAFDQTFQLWWREGTDMFVQTRAFH